MAMFRVNRNDRILSGLGIFLYRDNFTKEYKKMTISWSFSYNSFVKFHGKKIWEPHDIVIPKSRL